MLALAFMLAASHPGTPLRDWAAHHHAGFVCSEASLKGRYDFSASGTQVANWMPWTDGSCVDGSWKIDAACAKPGNPSEPVKTQFFLVGAYYFDGNGRFQVNSISKPGTNNGPPTDGTFWGTYTISRECKLEMKDTVGKISSGLQGPTVKVPDFALYSAYPLVIDASMYRATGFARPDGSSWVATGWATDQPIAGSFTAQLVDPNWPAPKDFDLQPVVV
jgi:hypothetical protein